jgi:hypothetical protein
VITSADKGKQAAEVVFAKLWDNEEDEVWRRRFTDE